MAKNLVIVESPAKAKTIQNILGSDFEVKASMGHVRDLPNKKAELTPTQQKLPYASLAIDVENNFAPLYVVSPGKKKTVQGLKKDIDENTIVWLASDEDREGEAIAYHLTEALGLNKKTAKNQVYRIAFHEITKSAIDAAIQNPRDIDMNMVQAQQTRRVIDRLVWYKLSPLLWKKVRFGLSAGRVQSAAVRIIVDREHEINAFIPEEYWSISAQFQTNKKKQFEGKLTHFKEKKVAIKNENEAKTMLDSMQGKDGEIINIEEKEKKKSPSAPFTTSTLQQEAARKLGFPVRKTMQVAQSLYEGISGMGGLITYMRTDSTNLSGQAIAEARSVIAGEYGDQYVPEKPRVYTKKQKGAQEAHEAIRPTSLGRKPQSIQSKLTPDQLKLYDLIWKRTIATQMADAKFLALSVDTKVGDGLFRSTGQKILFPGFILAYTEGHDDPSKALDDKEILLPELSQNEKVAVQEIIPQQHFTQAPPRYTEASLVKKMETEGIGRPSTYAPTIQTIQSRGYVVKEDKALKPTDTAFVVTKLLQDHFENIVDLKFTADMEEKLDEIAEGEAPSLKVTTEFYKPFIQNLEKKEEELKKADLTQIESLETPCRECGKDLVKKLGKFGAFVSCSNYPECTYAAQLDDNGNIVEQKEPEMVKEETCEKCNHEGMYKKEGPFGPYFECPECKTRRSIQEKVGVTCPKCGKGEMVIKKNRRGQNFYACNQYPKCKTALSSKPTGALCEKCESPLVEGKDGSPVCSNKKCK